MILDKIREKYPAYRDVPDEVLGPAIVKKYPQYLQQDQTLEQWLPKEDPNVALRQELGQVREEGVKLREKADEAINPAASFEKQLKGLLAGVTMNEAERVQRETPNKGGRRAFVEAMTDPEYGQQLSGAGTPWKDEDIRGLQQHIEAKLGPTRRTDAANLARSAALFNKETSRLQEGAAMDRWNRSKDGTEAWEAFKQDPGKIITGIVAGGLGSSLPMLANAAISSAVSGPASAVAGPFGGANVSYLSESGSKMMEAMQESGVDVTDPEQVFDALRGGKVTQEVREKASKRGMGVATFDFASMAVAGRLAPLFKNKLIGGATEALAQGVLGATGEAAGSLAIGERPSIKAMAEEFIGEIVPGVGEAAVNQMFGPQEQNFAGTPTVSIRNGVAVDQTGKPLPQDQGGEQNEVQEVRQAAQGAVQDEVTEPAGQPVSVTEQVSPTAETGAQAETPVVPPEVAAESVEPTEAQKEAGNYKKPTVQWQGLTIAVENPAGSERTGTDADGNTWSVTMPADYGYIKKTEGKDGDQVDVYMGPNRDAGTVFVVDQVDLDGKFDEHKSMIGFNSESEAVQTYVQAFSDGKGIDRVGAVTEMPVEQFKKWVKNGDTTKPIAFSPGQSYSPKADTKKFSPERDRPTVQLTGPDGKTYPFRLEGVQEGPPSVGNFRLFTPLVSVPGIPDGSTVADRSMIKNGWVIPEQLFAPASENPQLSIGDVEQQLIQLTGTDALPERVSVVHEPDANYAGYHMGGRVVINAAKIQSPEHLAEVLYHESIHGIFADPQVREQIAEWQRAVNNEDIERERARRQKLDTDPDVLLEEATITRILENRPEDRGLIARFFSIIANAFRRLFGMEIPQSSRDTILQAALQYALTPLDTFYGEKRYVPTKVGGVDVQVLDRPQYDPLEMQKGYDETQSLFHSVGIPTTVVSGSMGSEVRATDLTVPNKRGLEKLIARGNEIRAAWNNGREAELSGWGIPTLDSLRKLAAHLEQLHKTGKEGMWGDDPSLIARLFEAGQSQASKLGLGLRMHATGVDDPISRALQIDATLGQAVDEAYFGGLLDPLVKSIQKMLREYFGDTEINDALQGDAGKSLMGLVREAISKPEMAGGKLYRMVQGRMVPKKKKLKTLLKNARTEEAAQAIIERIVAAGIPEPPKSKGLTVIDRLVDLVKPENIEIINLAISQAVGEAERQAARGVWFESIKNEPDAKERLDAYDEKTNGAEDGPDPTPEQIEEGLDNPKYSHWRVVRDEMLGYSPVTDKLYRRVIRDGFKGVKYPDGKETSPDLRIDLGKLATEPDVEVSRVIGAHLDNLKSRLGQGDPVHVARVIQEISRQVDLQLKSRRQEIIANFLSSPDVNYDPKSKKTEAEHKAEVAARQKRLEKLINAGILEGAPINEAAKKNAVTILLPKISELIKQVVNTPLKDQSALKSLFAQRLASIFSLDEARQKQAEALFETAFETKFRAARERALKQAQDALAPGSDTQVMVRNNPRVWDKVTAFFNSGGLDTNEIFRDFAREKGWKQPSDAELEEIRSLIAREQDLRTPPPERVAFYKGDVDQATLETLKANDTEIRKIRSRVETMLKTWSHPIAGSVGTWYKDKEQRINTHKALLQWVSSNILLGPLKGLRLLVDVTFQRAPQISIRSWANTHRAYMDALASGKEPDRVQYWKDVSFDLWNSIRANVGTLKQAYRAGMEAIKGNPTDARQHESLRHNLNVAERISLRMERIRKDLESETDVTKKMAGYINLFTTGLWWVGTLGHQTFGAVDSALQVGTEWQEVRQQTILAMRKMGMSNAEIQLNLGDVMSTMATEMGQAISDIQAVHDLKNISASKAQIEKDAFNLIRGRAYERLKKMGQPADQFEEQNKTLARYQNWNMTAKGPGGILAGMLHSVEGFLIQYLPIPVGLFANAMGTALNRALTWSGGGLFPGIYGYDPSKPDSWNKAHADPGYLTAVDRTQRRGEAVMGLAVSSIIGSLIMTGVIVFRGAWPRDRKEREEWLEQGIRPWTLEFPIIGGKKVRIPLKVGPFAPMTPAIAFFGEARNRLNDNIKRQTKLNEEAAKKGLPPVEVDGLSIADIFGASAQAAIASLTGGKTFSGTLGAYSDFGTFDANKFVASSISGFIPALPAYQEISRAANVRIDPQRADLFDLLVPTPTSGARRLNFLGDPTGDPNAVSRIFEQITLGGGVVNPSRDSLAYQNIFATAYRPPPIDPMKGYEIDGQFRPFTGDELNDYTKYRGEELKAELGSVTINPLDPMARLKVQRAYARANNRALSRMRVRVPRLKRVRTGGRRRLGSRRGVLRGRLSTFGRVRSSIRR